MAVYTSRTRPAQFRLPEWAVAFVQERSAAAGTTKTEVVLEALECLRHRDVERLMAEGYAARAADSEPQDEDALRAAEETWPEW